jgi:hypothetical protein
MYRKVWEACRSSVCSIDFLSDAGTRITTFTAFKIKDFLVTDDVIDKFEHPAEVMLGFTDDGQNRSAEITMPFKEFLHYKVEIRKDFNPGYVLFNLDIDKFREIPSLKCSKKVNYTIGHPIAVLGYQLEQENLAIKSGIISSLFRHTDGFNSIQVDCTITQGNAGSPLIDAESLEVIGVIGHKLASIARSYKQMMSIINSNLKVLKEAEGKINMEEIDPIQVLIANQSQIKHMAKEFFKTASLRVGYAAELCNLIDWCPDPEDISSIDLKQNLDN